MSAGRSRAFGDDAMDGGDRGDGVALDRRLVLDRGECVVRDVFALEREQLLHGCERDVDLLIVEIVVAAADLVRLARRW